MPAAQGVFFSSLRGAVRAALGALPILVLALSCQAANAAGDQASAQRNEDLYIAAYGGDVHAVESLLDRGADMEYVRAGASQTVLQAVIAQVRGDESGGQMQVIKLLVTRGARLGPHKDAKGTALFTAVGTNGIEEQTPEQVDIVRFLLDHGAGTGPSDSSGDTPLHMAADALHLEAAQLLIDHGAKVTALDHDGRTPLKVARTATALQYGVDNKPMIALLEKAGAK